MPNPIRAVDAFRETKQYLDEQNTNQLTDQAQRDYVRAAPEDRAGVIQSVAAQPGSGNIAAKLYSDHEKSTGALGDHIHALLKSNSPTDIDYARQLATKNNVPLPDQVFTDANVRARFTAIMDAGKAANFTSPEQWKTLLPQAMGSQNTAQQAFTESLPNVPEQKKVGTPFRTQEGNIGVLQSGFSDSNTKVFPQRVQSLGRGGAGSKGYEFEARINALASEGQRRGMSAEDALGLARSVVLLKQNVTPQDRARMAQSMMKATDRLGRPLYKTPQEAQAAADQTIGWMQQQTVLPSGQAQASNQAPAAVQLAPTNPAERVVGQQYSSPTGSVGTWMGDHWEVE